MLAFHRLYGQSKLAQIYHAKEVSKLAKEQGEHVIAVSLHPGAVATDVTRYFNLWFYQAVTSLTDIGLACFGKTCFIPLALVTMHPTQARHRWRELRLHCTAA
jgi:NAD(P)-dependent dehydrogenase (short-subunit alcohol dehydrogenase family)